MSRIETTFANLKQQGRRALIPYVMAGDPNPSVTVPLLHKMVEAGADVLELGLPFSDPMADGPVIALAAERALAAGTNTLDVLDMVDEFRKTDQTTPIVLMGYLNPLEIIGYQVFVDRAATAGVDGLLLVDLPPEASGQLINDLAKKDMDLIFLIAPTTTHERIQKILSTARGYVYYVSLNGVTGSNTLNAEIVTEKLTYIRSQTDLPIGVGFGISDRASAQAAGKAADGVIVGSAFVKQFGLFDANKAVELAVEKVVELRQALDDMTLLRD